MDQMKCADCQSNCAKCDENGCEICASNYSLINDSCHYNVQQQVNNTIIAQSDDDDANSSLSETNASLSETNANPSETNASLSANDTTPGYVCSTNCIACTSSFTCVQCAFNFTLLNSHC